MRWWSRGEIKRVFGSDSFVEKISVKDQRNFKQVLEYKKSNSMKLREIIYPTILEYSSDGENLPIEFYIKTIPIAKKLDFKLGYFSSNAIKLLAVGFAQFIYNGGVLRLMTNHFLSKTDKSVFFSDNYVFEDSGLIEYMVAEDLQQLAKTLAKGEQHFWDCLRFLYEKERLLLFPVMAKPNKMVHYKEGIIDDGIDKIFFSGSCNFTYKGILENAESLNIWREWERVSEKAKVEMKVKEYSKIFDKSHESYIYLSAKEIVEVIFKEGQSKDLTELIDDAIDLYGYLQKQPSFSKANSQLLELEDQLQKIKIEPRFPYPSGPRDYQKEAYKAWVNNGKTGVFAMATGTGKTITSLNCILNEYKQSGNYRVVVLVPTIALVEQWQAEIANFNFKEIIQISSEHDWKSRIADIKRNLRWGIDMNYFIIVTYRTFSMKNFYDEVIQKLPDDTIIIADEAHNIGAPNVKKVFKDILFQRRIALSATPERIYDKEGTKEIQQFFNDLAPYCYQYTMKKAIDEVRLCKYYYYPFIVTLTDEEMIHYVKISKQLFRYFDPKSKKIKSCKEVEKLLLLRKQIIHKAANKIECLREIVKEITKTRELKYTFIYAPEGYDKREEDNDNRIIERMQAVLCQEIPNISASTFLGEGKNKREILEWFSEGKIDVLLSMKCLDEGVDIPRTEIGIFASSTGNPRQYIQRRGRLLRTHKDKNFAYIYDMVVVPNYLEMDEDFYNIERSLVKGELVRVTNFAKLALNFYDSEETLQHICKYYQLSLDTILNEIENDNR